MKIAHAMEERECTISRQRAQKIRAMHFSPPLHTSNCCQLGCSRQTTTVFCYVMKLRFCASCRARTIPFGIPGICLINITALRRGAHHTTVPTYLGSISIIAIFIRITTRFKLLHTLIALIAPMTGFCFSNYTVANEAVCIHVVWKTNADQTTPVAFILFHFGHERTTDFYLFPLQCSRIAGGFYCSYW